jgi:glycerol 2-dehydrogenase (NADP+)
MKARWEGKIRSIGVSNFSEMKLNEILPTAKIVPAVNQLELHLWNPQHKLCAFLREKGIVPQAYSPLGSTNSPLFKDETASKIAGKYGVTTADVLLGFLVANDIVTCASSMRSVYVYAESLYTVPKSVSPARIKSNLDNTLATAKKLKENPTDLEELNGVAASGKQHRFIMPPWPIELGFDNWVKK